MAATTNNDNEQNLPIDPASPVVLTTSVAMALAIVLFVIGFVLGFFPAVLGDNGTLTRGIDHGWKYGLVFLGAMATIGAIHTTLKKFSVPPLVISVLMGMVGLAIMQTVGGIVTEDTRPWEENLLRGLGSGAFIGAVIYWAQRHRPQGCA